MSPSAIAYLVGSALIFFAERIFASNDTLRWSVLLLGVLVALGGMGRRALSLDRHRSATLLTLGFYGLSAASGLVYLLGTDSVVDSLGLTGDSRAHFQTAVQALVPLLWLLGVMPAINLDRALHNHPHGLNVLRVRNALEGGLGVGLGLAMLFPLNYLAAEYNTKLDYGFFRTTAVGSATRQVVDNLPEPIEVALFFPASSEVLREVRPYFDELSGPMLSIEVVDQVADPETAKAYKVRENGVIAIKRDTQTENIKLGDDLNKARKDLRKLDSKVHTALLKLAREKRTAYFTVGHNELFWKNAPRDDEKIDLTKKLIENMNFKVKELGVDDGLGQAVPEDAALVFIVGPKAAFLPQELQALTAYRDQGGAMLLALEPPTSPTELVDTGLTDLFGVEYTPYNLLTDKDRAFIQVSGGITDRANVGTNKFSSHETVTTLSKNAAQAVLITPTVGAIKEKAEHAGKYTATVKGMPEWWADLNGNYQFDKDTEKRGTADITAVLSGPAEGGKEWRMAVVGDATWLANPFIQVPANAVLLAETLAWLTQDPALGGETESEEDVKIQHTKEGQKYWFYGASILMPALVLGLGTFWVSLRRRKGAA